MKRKTGFFYLPAVIPQLTRIVAGLWSSFGPSSLWIAVSSLPRKRSTTGIQIKQYLFLKHKSCYNFSTLLLMKYDSALSCCVCPQTYTNYECQTHNNPKSPCSRSLLSTSRLIRRSNSSPPKGSTSNARTAVFTPSVSTTETLTVCLPRSYTRNFLQLLGSQ